MRSSLQGLMLSVILPAHISFAQGDDIEAYIHPLEREIPYEVLDYSIENGYKLANKMAFGEWCNELVNTVDQPDSRYHYNQRDAGEKFAWLNRCQGLGRISQFQRDNLTQEELGLEREVLDNLNCSQLRNDISYSDFSTWTLGYLSFLSACSISNEDIQSVRRSFGAPIGWMNDDEIDFKRAYTVIKAMPRELLMSDELELLEDRPKCPDAEGIDALLDCYLDDNDESDDRSNFDPENFIPL